MGDPVFLIMAEGYPNQLVREDRRWLCNLCKHLLREPVLVSCCRYKFCRVCINGWRRKGVNPEECPYCRAPAYETVVEKDLERMLLDKQVWCSHRFQGCRWKGTLRNALKHEETDCQCTECCQQRRPCRFSKYGCDHIVPLAKEEAHYTEHCQHHLSLGGLCSITTDNYVDACIYNNYFYVNGDLASSMAMQTV